VYTTSRIFSFKFTSTPEAARERLRTGEQQREREVPVVLSLSQETEAVLFTDRFHSDAEPPELHIIFVEPVPQFNVNPPALTLMFNIHM
jgi:hypothetical protein